MNGSQQPLSLFQLIATETRYRALEHLAFLQSLWGQETAPEDWLWIRRHQELLTSKLAWRETDATADKLVKEIEACAFTLKGEPGRWRQNLAKLFSLDSHDLAIIDLAVALHQDCDLKQVLQALQPGRKVLDLQSLLAALHDDICADNQKLLPGQKLLDWGLVQTAADGLPRADRLILNYLSGGLSMDPILEPFCSFGKHHGGLPEVEKPVTVAFLKKQLICSQPVYCHVITRPNDMLEERLTGLCHQLGLRLLIVGPTHGLSINDRFDLAMRLDRISLLGGCAILFNGPENAASNIPVRTCPIVFSQADAHVGANDGVRRLDTRLHLRPASPQQRNDFIQYIEKQASLSLTDDVRDHLGRSVGLTYEDTDHMIRRAPGSLNDLLNLMEQASVRRSASFGVLRTPVKCMDDIVLKASIRDNFQEAIFEADYRLRNAEKATALQPDHLRGGLSILLHGAPGTGKTLAAEVIANALGRNLLVIDPASVSSKFIGDTAKHLRTIFQEASLSGDVIFLDEADSYVTRRTEVRNSNDRHSNADTNNILQLIDNHVGITVLATNRMTDFDRAALRRMRYIIEFPAPEKNERLAMWQKSLGEVGASTLLAAEALLENLAITVEFTPARIKSAVTTAFYLASQGKGSIELRHLLKGVGAELAKEGRVLAERDAIRLSGFYKKGKPKAREAA